MTKRGKPNKPERYNLMGVLGEGGMAIVYDGYDTTLERPVAIKVLRPDMAQDPEKERGFFYEARLLAQMDHPGVIPVFEMGELPKHGSFYAMKKIRGQTLGEILDGMTPADFARPHEIARLMQILEKVCLTVAYAHARGIIHRDLKPDNIMVDDYGVVMVLDWGLSKRIDKRAEKDGINTTQVGTIKGTPGHMSPEQAGGKSDQIDFRTDVFALGIILYECLTGRVPFSGSSQDRVLQEIIHRDPPHPHRLNRRVSRVLCAICMKALNKNPDKRYPTAKELAEDIRRYRDHQPTSAYRVPLWDRLGTWLGRHPTVATALTLALIFGGFAYHYHNTTVIRMMEQQKAEQLAQALEEQREIGLLNRMVTVAKELSLALQVLDERILATEEEKAGLSEHDTEGRAALNAKLEELKAARLWHTYGIESVATAMIVTAEAPDQAPADLDSPLINTIRNVALEEVRNLIKIGEYYKAHNRVWAHLLEAQRIGWNEAQTAELLKLKSLIEAKMREGKGPDFTVPDWDEYRPERLLEDEP